MDNNHPAINNLPDFQHIEPSKIESQLQQLLNENRTTLSQLLGNKSAFTWQNLVEPLDDMADRLHQYWSPIVHLHSVADNQALRGAYQACLPFLEKYHTELDQNEALFQAYQAIAASPAFAQFNQPQRKIIENELRDFRLSGIHLPQEGKKQYAAIQQKLVPLSNQFEMNVLDATQGWTLLITDKAELAGLPQHALVAAEAAASEKGQQGWLLTLDYPCYDAVISYADNRKLREQMYFAYATRASDQGPQAGRWDNSTLITQILALRHEKARLLGFNNYVEYSLATKMAHTPDQVLHFLQDLVARVRPVAQREFDELRAFAKQHDGREELAAWDIPYYSEKQQQHLYQLTSETLRPYFPIEQVLAGMFALVARLYGITITEKKGISTWNPEVRFFEIFDQVGGRLVGQFYVDLYARNHKRSGAWMDEYRPRRLLQDGSLQIPIAYLTCNFTPPSADKPGLLTHEEVLTLFHEFGHGLHHLLTEIDYLGASGMQGVSWDAVELPSQFMEHWCWQRPVIDSIAKHYQTDEPLPESLWQNMLAAKNFHAGLFLIRQLEFALFDLRIHLEYDTNRPQQVQEILNDIRKNVGVIQPPTYHRFQHSFGHIFSGGYDAGYYSYLWADVLASDAFAKFEEDGIFNPSTGKQFLKTILSQGGSRDAMELFVAFRGREPDISALLRHRGLLPG